MVFDWYERERNSWTAANKSKPIAHNFNISIHISRICILIVVVCRSGKVVLNTTDTCSCDNLSVWLQDVECHGSPNIKFSSESASTYNQIKRSLTREIMSIVFACKCGKTQRVSDKYAGHQASCRHCKSKFVIPSRSTKKNKNKRKSSTEGSGPSDLDFLQAHI